MKNSFIINNIFIEKLENNTFSFIIILIFYIEIKLKG